MTNEDIIKLAMEYGFTGGFDAQGNLTYDATFVEAVTEAIAATRKETLEEMIYAHPTTAIKKAVAYEREACAKVCDELAELNRFSETDSMWEWGECAAAIRARGNV
jgi:hypothetical protein